MATGKQSETLPTASGVDLDDVNKRAADAGEAAVRKSNGEDRERGRLADAKPSDK